MADAARRNEPITYSDVVQGIEFTLDDGRRHTIDIHNWTGLDQRIIGQFLGFISVRTYDAHEFMASALAVDATNMQPSKSFFDFALNIGALVRDTERERTAFWIRQFNLAHEHYSKQPVLPTAADFNIYTRTVLEGVPTTLTTTTRSRCAVACHLAKEHYRGADGLLRCEACVWAKPSRIEADIVELYHRDPLAAAREEGRQLTIDEAIGGLMPLCPNCHRIAHAKPGGGIYTLDELQDILTSNGA